MLAEDPLALTSISGCPVLAEDPWAELSIKACLVPLQDLWAEIVIKVRLWSHRNLHLGKSSALRGLVGPDISQRSWNKCVFGFTRKT